MAADMQATYGSLKRKSCKLIPVHVGKKDYVVGLVGSIVPGHVMLEWIRQGSKPNLFPAAAQQGEEWCRVVVGEVGSGRIWYYDRQPIGIPVLDAFSAWGSAEDIAIGCLSMKATAKQAVEICCQFSTDCGLGVEEYRLIN